VSQEPLAAIREVFEEFNARIANNDLESLRPFLAQIYAPDAELDYSATTPDGGKAVGTDGMVQFLERAQGTMEGVQFKPLDVVASGNTMVISMRLSGRGSSSGTDVAMDYAYLNRLDEDGKIVSSRTYRSLKEALEAAGLSSP
jgi:ketosteroid isomerase-like protein